MAGSPGFESIYRDRFVCNSGFVDNTLFDVQHMQKIIAMCRFVKPDVLFSDVVKMKPVSRNSIYIVNNTNMKAKIEQNRITDNDGKNNTAKSCINKSTFVNNRNPCGSEATPNVYHVKDKQ